MLREASLNEMKQRAIPKENRVLVNRGRGNDELSPSDELFRDFTTRKLELEDALGKGSDEAHNRAFLACGYEPRFRLQISEDPKALARLEDLARRAEREELYFVCYEGAGKACHRRILLRMAEELFGAPVAVEGVEPR